MAEQAERLSGPASKAKRNIWLFSLLALALAAGWVEPIDGTVDDTRVSFGGIGAKTTLEFVLWFLLGALVFTIGEFWLHGPFGDSRAAQRRFFLIDPNQGDETGAYDAFKHITTHAGQNAISGVQNSEDLDRLLNNLTQTRWNQDHSTRRRALEGLWSTLSWCVVVRLGIHGVWCHRRVRKLVFEDATDLWLTLGAGGGGIVAVVVALIDLSRTAGA